MNQSKSCDPRFLKRWTNSGAIKCIRFIVDPRWGSEIHSTVVQAIEMAKLYNQLGLILFDNFVPMSLISFDFNGVKVDVCQDSDPKLIYRDWERARSQYIIGKVGPYPKAELSAKDLASDKRISDADEARWAKESAERKVVQDQKEREFFLEINTCPSMDRDEAKWQEGIKAQKDQQYGLAIFTYAEYWARLMQKEMGEGCKLKSIADECSSDANIPCGITGFMYGCAVSVLAQCWKHGEELRVWHNKKYQLGDEGEQANKNGGVLNPALLSFG